MWMWTRRERTIMVMPVPRLFMLVRTLVLSLWPLAPCSSVSDTMSLYHHVSCFPWLLSLWTPPCSSVSDMMSLLPPRLLFLSIPPPWPHPYLIQSFLQNVSWFPPPHIWDLCALNVSQWTEECEKWFERHVSEIHSGTFQPLSSKAWRIHIRNTRLATKVTYQMKKGAADFISANKHFLDSRNIYIRKWIYWLNYCNMHVLNVGEYKYDRTKLLNNQTNVGNWIKDSKSESSSELEAVYRLPPSSSRWLLVFDTAIFTPSHDCLYLIQ